MSLEHKEEILQMIDKIGNFLVDHAIEAGHEFPDDQLEEACNELDNRINQMQQLLGDRTRELFWDR